MARKTFDIYMFLTHAIWHCTYGPGLEDRKADAGDQEAAGILTELRTQIARDKVRGD